MSTGAEESVIRARIGRGLAIHGGVGTLPREAMTPELAAGYERDLREALNAGHRVLEEGGTAMDAAVAAVVFLEDTPRFNAGRGSNFDERGVITMDASVMDGRTRDGGAVAGVTDVRSPVTLARLVMERSPHAMLIGEGAEGFARSQGIPATEPSFFHTDRRWDQLQAAKVRSGGRPNVLGGVDLLPGDRSGTVGAVALDGDGGLAAATSTGGMANKARGRVGDSPVIGAGTYASDSCAVSCTGWGEYFIRYAAAYDVHARMVHGAASLADAVRGVIFDTLHRQVPGSGGLVAVDAAGHVELAFNTPGMYRGWIDEEGEARVALYGAPDAPSDHRA